MNITRPTLLLDKKKCLANIRFMADRAAKLKVSLRPHFKTHQSAEIGEWFRQAGTSAITVSSVKMAEYFAGHGWNDITIAFPFNIHEAEALNKLAEKNKINIVVESAETCSDLARRLRHPVNALIKIDTGYRRTGIPFENTDEIERVIRSIKNPLVFLGFLAHAGHTYQADSLQKINAIQKVTVDAMNGLKRKFSSIKPDLLLSIGDTPGCSLADNFSGMDEIRPGNYVFYDVQQSMIGSCTADRIAVAMACPVVAKHKERNELIIHGGGVHFAKDFMMRDDGARLFGRVVELGKGSWSEPMEGIYVKSLSQEHGVLKADSSVFDKFKAGDFLGVLPVHSCLTADAMKGYLTLEGERLEHLEGVPSGLRNNDSEARK